VNFLLVESKGKAFPLQVIKTYRVDRVFGYHTYFDIRHN